jgi:cytidylate kinase
LKEKGIDVSLPDLSREIAERDRRDASRSVAPLRPAEGARVVDSTGVTVEEVLVRITQWLTELGIA